MTQTSGSRAVAEARSVTKRYFATAALVEVSLSIRAGVSHGLVGRNGAGKSTLVRLLTVLEAPDEGEVLLQGESAPAASARDEWLDKVACVYQHPTVVPDLSVAENIFLNAAPRTRRGLVDWRTLRRMAAQELATWDIDLDPDVAVATLTVEQRQLVEIARALRRGSRFIILDEPTAQLDGREIRRLFNRLRQLQEGGVTFLYISHHLEEIYELCEDVTVLRNGRHVLTEPVSEVPKPRMVKAMVGEQHAESMPSDPIGESDRPRESDGDATLTLRGVRAGSYAHEVSLSVGDGECVGLAGQASSGKGDVGDAIAGLLEPTSGDILVGGQSVLGKDVSGRIDAGIGYVPEDRHRRGLVPLMTVEEHATMSIQHRLVRFGFIRRSERRRRAQEMITLLEIKASSLGQMVGELSGGNQQKTVMARALVSGPRVLVLNKPTAGVDIAAKEVLYDSVARACAAGTATLVISDEVEELAICDRVLVMHRGQITAEFRGERSDEELVAAMEGVDAK